MILLVASGQYESRGDDDESTETFVYTISDGNGGTDGATVAIGIVDRNDVPDAEDNVLLDPFPAASPVGGQNILSNDSDAEDDNLTVTRLEAGTLPVAMIPPSAFRRA